VAEAKESLLSAQPAAVTPNPDRLQGGVPTSARPGVKAAARGVDSPVVGLPPITDKVREFRVLNPEEKEKIESLKVQFWRSKDRERRLEILNQIEQELYGIETTALVREILGSEEEEFRLRAVELLAGNISPEILPALDQALDDGSEQVRLAAVSAVGEVRDDAVVGFFARVFHDLSADVRFSGLNALDGQTTDRRLKILGKALQAPDATVQLGAIDVLQMESTPASIEVLFNALDSADPKVQDEARFSLDFIVDQEFRSAADARAWWRKHRDEFDHELTRK
jgi:HEAT repeat protein